MFEFSPRYSTSADLNDDEDDQTQKFDLELEISANYNSSDDFHLTAFGNYFINQCKLKDD